MPLFDIHQFLWCLSIGSIASARHSNWLVSRILIVVILLELCSFDAFIVPLWRNVLLNAK